VLRQHLEEYHRTFKGNMLLGKILQAANIKWEELPQLPGYIDDKGRNMLCFSHICGRCTFRPCRLRKGHVPPEKIPNDWAESLWKQIEPGVRYMLRSGGPTAEGSSPSKKQRM
jgi:hypothetical protein